MTNCRSRSVCFFRSQLIWICTVCKGRVYPGSAGQGLNKFFIENLQKIMQMCLHDLWQVFIGYPFPLYSVLLWLCSINTDHWLVSPVLEYGSCVWDPQGVVLQQEIKKVQNRAARFLASNYCFETWSVSGILGKKWESLKKRRRDRRLILMYLCWTYRG